MNLVQKSRNEPTKKEKHLQRLLSAYKLRVVYLTKQNSDLSRENAVLKNDVTAVRDKPRLDLDQPGRVIRNDVTVSGGEVISPKKTMMTSNGKGKSKGTTKKKRKLLPRSMTGCQPNNELDVARKWNWTKNELEYTKNELVNCKEKLKKQENNVQLYVSGLARLNSIVEKKDSVIQNLKLENTGLRKWVSEAKKVTGKEKMRGKFDNLLSARNNSANKK